MDSLESILEEATRISAKTYKGGGVFTPRGKPYMPSVCVKWPAEVKSQYTRVYSDPAKVAALIELESQPGWTLESNFQLAHRFSQPTHHWLNSKPSRIQLHIRPGIQVSPAWPYGAAFAPDAKDEFVADVREAINQVLSALDEPRLRC